MARRLCAREEDVEQYTVHGSVIIADQEKRSVGLDLPRLQPYDSPIAFAESPFVGSTRLGLDRWMTGSSLELDLYVRIE